VFAINVKYSKAREALQKGFLRSTRQDGGIETGFRVQNTVNAMTTSQNYTIRIIYQMLSVIIYNLWQLANILLAVELLTVRLKAPLIKLTHLARIFSNGDRDASHLAAQIITFGSTELGMKLLCL
jgi:hypothetical protein